MLGRHHLMKTGPVRRCAVVGSGPAGGDRAPPPLRGDHGPPRPRCATGTTRSALLPYGIQKRIELGRALAMDPRLLLLDEPVAGMNLEETEDMAGHISEIRKELDMAIILVEHQMDLVMDLVDRLLVLAFGRVVATGSPSDIQ